MFDWYSPLFLGPSSRDLPLANNTVQQLGAAVFLYSGRAGRRGGLNRTHAQNTHAEKGSAYCLGLSGWDGEVEAAVRSRLMTDTLGQGHPRFLRDSGAVADARSARANALFTMQRWSFALFTRTSNAQSNHNYIRNSHYY